MKHKEERENPLDTNSMNDDKKKKQEEAPVLHDLKRSLKAKIQRMCRIPPQQDEPPITYFREKGRLVAMVINIIEVETHDKDTGVLTLRYGACVYRNPEWDGQHQIGSIKRDIRQTAMNRYRRFPVTCTVYVKKHLYPEGAEAGWFFEMSEVLNCARARMVTLGTCQRVPISEPVD